MDDIKTRIKKNLLRHLDISDMMNFDNEVSLKFLTEDDNIDITDAFNK